MRWRERIFAKNWTLTFSLKSPPDFYVLDWDKIRDNIRESVCRDCEKQARHTDQSPEELMEQAEETARLMSEKVDL
ncbi:MAG: hypothetical protein ABEJ65_00505 [bacterium]